MLADAKWKTVSWRTGTKGKLKLALPPSVCESPTDHRSG
jgi:hypothetical protein